MAWAAFRKGSDRLPLSEAPAAPSTGVSGPSTRGVLRGFFFRSIKRRRTAGRAGASAAPAANDCRIDRAPKYWSEEGRRSGLRRGKTSPTVAGGKAVRDDSRHGCVLAIAGDRKRASEARASA